MIGWDSRGFAQCQSQSLPRTTFRPTTAGATRHMKSFCATPVPLPPHAAWARSGGVYPSMWYKLPHIFVDGIPYWLSRFALGKEKAEQIDHATHPPNQGNDGNGISCPPNDGSGAPPSECNPCK